MTQWPFVGRSAQVDRLAGALRRPGGLVVCGGAGTGKTRLLAAARERVPGVYWATGAPGVPLGPFAPLIRPTTSVEAQLSLAAAALVARRGAVAVDDAHRLDAASVALLAHLVANTTVPVVLTVRGTGPLPWPWLRDLDRVTLGPLDPTEVAEVLEQALGGPVETALAARLAELSQGNPLLLRELVDAARLRRNGGVWRAQGPLVVADSLPAAIAARLDRLPPDVRATAELVALAEPVPADALEHLLTADERQGLEDERLLATASPGEVRLVHPLYAESLKATVPPLRARAHCRRLATLPATLPRLRVVGWRLDGGLPVEPAELLEAAREASEGLDHELAARLARAAVAAGGGFEARMVLLAELPYEQRGDEALALAAELADTATGDAERVRVASARSNLDLVLGRVESARSVLAEARATAKNPALRIRLALQQAAQAFSTGHIALSLDHGDEVPTDDPAVLGRLAISRVRALACAGRTGDAISLGEATLRALRASRGIFGDAVSTRTALVRMALLQAYAFHGRIALAREVGTTGLAEAAATPGGAALRAYWTHELGQVAVLAGHAEAGVRWLREAVALMPIAGLPASPHLWSLDALAEAYALRGDADNAAATAGRLSAVLPAGFVPPRCGGAVWSVAATGETSRARDLALAHARTLEAAGSHLMAGWVLHDAHRLGATGVAPWLGRLADRSQSPLLRAMAANAAATEAAAMDLAAHDLAALGCDLRAAETLVRAGHLHRAGGHPAPALASAAAADRLLARCGPVRSVPATVADPLTAREREVVDLATRGHSDRDIAGRLHLSVRTVQSHLYRAYRKLGISGRQELPT
ncbi:helix-turn-helix transcriptional regulator [Virgisporangium aurantiacum]|uniref:LuxR family transcriptional regulator n=1 Tax=Virgisporangium aurantiacum TaxID=175570 RepID=A0A8J3ZCP1_9ACTN|nr:LuxR family transcriptional regulator [Virgisporangium aurantiacum]GIJ59270.1 LuxR family transcriptional regulator [Virgisporangium aurantiacum]